MRYTKHFTQKEWDRFDIEKQEILCSRYKIILDDWLPKWTRRYNTVQKYINQKNLDKGIKEFNNIIDTVTKGLDDLGKELDGDNKRKKPKVKLWSSDIDHNFIWGKKKKTRL